MFRENGGFDVVIGNPPYVQLQKKQKISANLQQSYRLENYHTFEKTGDIYALFYEMGLNLTKPETGLLSLITSNKWMRTNYGASLRGFFSWYQGRELIDFAGKSVFENATVDTNILTIQHRRSEQAFSACQIKDDYQSLRQYVHNNQGSFAPSRDKSWFIGSAKAMALKAKIEQLGTPLKDCDVKMNSGIKTGFNQAFIIDQQKYDALIAADPKSAEIIKPMLRGRDIQRYASTWNGEYLICSHNGYESIPPINIEKFPAVKKHLDQVEQDRADGKFGEKAKKAKGLYKREDQGATPYNLRDCAYYKDFEKEILAWPDIAKRGQFSLIPSGMYLEATVFIMTCEHPQAMTALLNSSLIHWYFNTICAGLGDEGHRWKKVYVEKIPMIPLQDASVAMLTSKVDAILSLAKCENYNPKNPPKQQLSLEAEIDELIFDLYQLTNEERELIRPSVRI